MLIITFDPSIAVEDPPSSVVPAEIAAAHGGPRGYGMPGASVWSLRLAFLGPESRATNSFHSWVLLGNQLAHLYPFMIIYYH